MSVKKKTHMNNNNNNLLVFIRLCNITGYYAIALLFYMNFFFLKGFDGKYIYEFGRVF